MRKFPIIGRFFLAFFSAFLLTSSFPEFDLEFLAWFALVPLLIAIKDKSLKSAFSLSFLTGIVFFMGIFYWINIVDSFNWIDFILMGIYLGSYFGIFGLGLNFISKKTKIHSIIIAPFVWVSIEYLRSHAGFLALPWALLGHSQYLNLSLIQISSFTGVYGISFLIVMVNVCLSEWILFRVAIQRENLTLNRSRLFKQTIITLSMLGISLVYGFNVLSKQPGRDKVNITVIQPNIPHDIKWRAEFRKQNLDKHVRITKEAIKGNNTSLIVWPGSTIPGFVTKDLYFFNTISALATEANSFLLFGSAQQPKFGTVEFRRKNWFNSAYLISPKGNVSGQYNKIRLFPFGEYLPYKDVIPWPSRISKTEEKGNAIPGSEYTIFNINNVKFGITICWESIFPELFQQFVKNGADFMINITNEDWFGETGAPYQFLSLSVFRAVENRISVVRSANTGVSCFIDSYGRIIGRVMDNNGKDTFLEGYLTMGIPILHQRTFYTIYGDVFAYINLIMAIFLMSLSFFPKITKWDYGYE